VIDYPCANFGDFSFSRFGFIVRCRQTESQNHHDDSTMNIVSAEADQRYTDATIVGVSNNNIAAECSMGGGAWSKEVEDWLIAMIYLCSY